MHHLPLSVSLIGHFYHTVMKYSVLKSYKQNNIKLDIVFHVKKQPTHNHQNKTTRQLNKRHPLRVYIHLASLHVCFRMRSISHIVHIILLQTATNKQVKCSTTCTRYTAIMPTRPISIQPLHIRSQHIHTNIHIRHTHSNAIYFATYLRSMWHKQRIRYEHIFCGQCLQYDKTYNNDNMRSSLP